MYASIIFPESRLLITSSNLIYFLIPEFAPSSNLHTHSPHPSSTTGSASAPSLAWASSPPPPPTLPLPTCLLTHPPALPTPLLPGTKASSSRTSSPPNAPLPLSPTAAWNSPPIGSPPVAGPTPGAIRRADAPSRCILWRWCRSGRTRESARRS